MKKYFSDYLNGFMATDFIYNVNQQNFLTSLELPGQTYDFFQSDIEVFEKDENIKYKLNNCGFRCDDFTKLEQDNAFLFSGCSITFGLGVPLEKTWASLLNKDLNGNKFYNLSIPAVGIETIIFNLNTYIEKYGKPKGIFILFPNLGRYPFYSNHFGAENLILKYAFIENENLVWGNPDFRLLAYRTINTIKLFENLCNEKRIPLIWSTWDFDTLKIFKELNIFKNMFDIPDISKLNLLSFDLFDKVDENDKYLLKARDGIHPGSLEHAYYYKLFKDEYINRYAP